EHAGDDVAQGVLVAQPLVLAQAAVEGAELLAYGGLEGTAVGAGGERLERREMARLRVPPRLLEPADDARHLREVSLGRLLRLPVGPLPPRLRHVSDAELLDLRGRGRVAVLGAREIEDALLHEHRGLLALEEYEVLVLAERYQRQDVELLPEPVELR